MPRSFRSSGAADKSCIPSAQRPECSTYGGVRHPEGSAGGDNVSFAPRRRRARTNAFLHAAPRSHGPTAMVERRQRRPRSNAFLRINNKSAGADRGVPIL
ncbi:hypothetical protein pneo_cds_419 [Pandoravirus neocaledonia]|uniref:Uncharacterized protein n=1 Tax=Pandoravirus neocaledonia TaxID=2107708 RepID=A0A2U7UC62_9VIRU|nr:hypothetical protein pneo_cds_419 [Pandoravirus neocaledonia]AVK76026.1 hypothetical protein pneo_cds_419 [Pandoravirus neocaledonia]